MSVTMLDPDCVLHECRLLKFSELSYEDKDRFEMEKKPGRVSF